MFQLRPYQAEAKQAILAAWDEGYRKTLLVLPTGCGKTVVFSSVTENQVKKGHRVLIMAHRGELLDQAADTESAWSSFMTSSEKMVCLFPHIFIYRFCQQRDNCRLTFGKMKQF